MGFVGVIVAQIAQRARANNIQTDCLTFLSSRVYFSGYCERSDDRMARRVGKKDGSHTQGAVGGASSVYLLSRKGNGIGEPAAYTTREGILSDVARLLLEPSIDIAREYSVPRDVFRKTRLTESSSLSVMVPAKTHNTVDSDVNEILLNQDFFNRSIEYLAGYLCI